MLYYRGRRRMPDGKDESMTFAYEIKNGEAVILRCYDYGTEAEIPEYIEGCPVTELAPYAFSAHREEKGLPLDGSETEPVLKGSRLTSVSLPPSLRKIGAYAFYNCSCLEKISFYGGLADLGAGLFTGCHGVKELCLTLGSEETSCLKEVLLEIPEKLCVEIEGKKRARLVFPEFFEESVENTPARILMIQMHGSGMNFRNSFYERKLDLRTYDSCFFMAKAAEDFDTVAELALSRLRFPADLTGENRKMYETWVKENASRVMQRAVKRQDAQELDFLTGSLSFSAGELQEAASLAAAEDFPEGTSILMNALYKKKKPSVKRFEL